MSLFGARLRYLRKQDGLTQADLAKSIGLAKSSISMYENGHHEPDFETLEKIADFFNVPIGSLFGTAQAGTVFGNIVPMPKMTSIPLVGDIACGTPVLAEQNIEEYIDLPEHIKADFALRCHGDSMIGADIHDGDIVYIRQQPEVRSGQIAAVLIDDEATLKRVYINAGTVILQPENPAYSPLAYSGEAAAGLRILGLAVAFTHALI